MINDMHSVSNVQYKFKQPIHVYVTAIHKHTQRLEAIFTFLGPQVRFLIVIDETELLHMLPTELVG